jgi:N6-adenosine-specific RNA methylase IME4
MENDTNLVNINESLAMVNNINTIPDARKLLALAQGYLETARKLYNPISINSIAEAGEDKNRGQDIAKKAGELKLYAEARLGELIKIEQDAGRLATQAKHPGSFVSSPNGTNVIQTLADYGLDKKDSYHAQQLAEHKDIIAKVIVDSLDIPTRAAVEKEIKNQKHEDQKIETSPASTPDGLFDVIVIDPPWPYGGEYDAESHRIESPYTELSIEDIIATNIPSSDNCILWLWTTNKFMHDAYHILEYWGFEPKTILTWVKNKLGIGYWLRGQTEHCVMAIKGKPHINLTNQSTYLPAINQGHSIKPDEFYILVNSLCTGKKLDMFARIKREGWESHGNQL